jgi:tetratricopeptide (TPR) repeat protein
MNVTRRRIVLPVLLLSILIPFAVLGQSEAEINEAMEKASALLDQGRFTDALPYLDKVVKARPDDADAHMAFGLALALGSKQVNDPAQGKVFSARALSELQTAKRLGSTNADLDALIGLLGAGPVTGGSGPARTLSDAEKWFSQAESLFAQSKYQEAVVLYKKALDADPKMYEAALYIGDCYVAINDFPNAEAAYQKAISIDPDRETAYRYSATPLMKQKKFDLARDRYIEAYIAEPYNKMSGRGISQWAEITNARLVHPKTDIPKFSYGPDGKPTTTMKESSLAEGSKAWVAYAQTRDAWHKKKFAETFPAEKTYRHSLAEEVDAIRSTLKLAKEQNLKHPDIELLAKLDNEGLLESFVLLTTPDQGIAEDYAAYRKQNREKLHRYVLNYLIHSGSVGADL